MDEFDWSDWDRQASEYTQPYFDINQMGRSDLNRSLEQQPISLDQFLNMSRGTTSDATPYDFSGGIQNTQYSEPSMLDKLQQWYVTASKEAEANKQMSPLARIAGGGWGLLTALDDYKKKNKLYDMQMGNAQQDRAWALQQRANQDALNTPFDTNIVARKQVAIDPRQAMNYGKLNRSTGQVYSPLMFDKSTPTVTLTPRSVSSSVNVLNKAAGGVIPGKEQCACGGLGLLRGGTAGQADKVPANVSHGEYVMDADVVSALGDGNTEAGAKVLDGMRQNIRQHKRSAPKSAIPPKAKSPLQYMKGSK